MKKGRKPSAFAARAAGGVAVMETVQHLNARCFALIADAVKSRGAGLEGHFPLTGATSFGSETDANLWAKIDERACERAGRCPVLLLDLHFRRSDWWARVLARVSRASSVGDFSRRSSVHIPAWLPPDRGLLTERAEALTLEILIEARQFSRSMPHAAHLLFGMSPAVRQAVSDFAIADIDRLATECASVLRPRWAERRLFWTRLLQAAISRNDQALESIQLECLQRLSS